MTAVSKNVHIDKLDEMVSKYNKTYHRTIKMKPADVKPDTYIEYDVYHNDKNHKVRVIIMSENQNQSVFTKGYTLNWPEDVFITQEIKNTVPWTYVIIDLSDEEIVRTFYEKLVTQKQ